MEVCIYDKSIQTLYHNPRAPVDWFRHVEEALKRKILTTARIIVIDHRPRTMIDSMQDISYQHRISWADKYPEKRANPCFYNLDLDIVGEFTELDEFAVCNSAEIKTLLKDYFPPTESTTTM